MSCEVSEYCKNNDSKCWLCLAANNGDILYYQKESQRDPDHPIRVAEKQEKKAKRDSDSKQKKDQKLKDKLDGVFDERKNRLKIATEREEKTNKTLGKLAAKQFANRSIRSSDGNSGRVTNNDDHVVLGGEIMYDTKSYSKKVHPPIDLDEYDTCRAKAIKHKANCYGQVVYNKDGRAFMVMDLELDWSYIQKKLNLTMMENGTDEN